MQEVLNRYCVLLFEVKGKQNISLYSFNLFIIVEVLKLTEVTMNNSISSVELIPEFICIILVFGRS